MKEESRPARRLPDADSASSIADGAEAIRLWPVPPQQLPVSHEERAWLRGLDDRELIRHVRGLSAVDRAVKSARKAAARKRAA